MECVNLLQCQEDFSLAEMKDFVTHRICLVIGIDVMVELWKEG
ncbi:hypothetical protein BVRB_1g023330 [Beta vulgaris subsp. vulgaris]|uniref:Uncharacterized protein n=1 Tax=Beta vulgaris subsp. vulgaris TaxID=3555 RepID=A0A0J8BHJ9_BETVV|nr:hypothetical protein BVRB_1g023330 [Beta vulgaris subsp. vulgaris]